MFYDNKEDEELEFTRKEKEKLEELDLLQAALESDDYELQAEIFKNMGI